MSYNIHGFENKYLYPNFFKYITSFDIFILVETHLTEEKVSKAVKYFPGFDISWIFAKKVSNFGRAIGGIMMAVKRNIKEDNIQYQFVKRNSVLSIEILFSDQQLTLIPLYIRSADWDNEFSILTKYMYDYEIINPLLMGDVNVRLGELQQYISPIHGDRFTVGKLERKSKDKEVNANGRKYLDFCDDFNLTILNGRTEGDEEGNLTFISTVGSSVNDICAVSQDILGNIKNFYVDEQIWSDHLPIVMELAINCNETENNKLTLLPKIPWINANKNKYQRNLNTNLAHQTSYTGLKQLTDTIIKSAEVVSDSQFTPKNKWFDIRCFWARKRVFKYLNKFRKSQNDQHREAYLRCKKRFNEICEDAKIRYLNNLSDRINNTTNGKEWWKIAKEINKQEFRIGNAITSAMFREYFADLLNLEQSSYDFHYAPVMVHDELLDRNITIQEVKLMLSKVKLNKAPGEDRVPYEFYINATDEYLMELAQMYSNIFTEGCVDESMINSIIFPIHKKGNMNEPANYRAISFMNTAAKILMGILNNRLVNWVEDKKIIVEYQAGFRKNYSTADNIYNLASITSIKLAEKKKLYAFFVDFRAAFDKVSRKALIYKLYSLGVSYKFTKMIESIYENTQSAVWNGEELSSSFNTVSGVKQGCLLSPLLFALYINDIHDFLEGGINIEGTNIRILMYADDIVIMAEDVSTLQKMISRLEQYCDLWNMEVNTGKSKIMVFRNGGRISNEEKWYFKGQDIEIVSEYNYLGVVFTPKLSFKSHVDRRIKQAKNAINSTWNNFLKKDNISLQMKWKIFLAVCRSIHGYAAQVWGFGHFDEVDKVQRFFLKRILKLPGNTPNYVIDLETNVEDGHIYTLQLHLHYIYRAMFEYNSDRLPNFLTKIIVQKKIFWSKAVNNLLTLHGEQTLDANTSRPLWYQISSRFIQTLYRENKFKKVQNAVSSSSRIYKQLDYTKGPTYINGVYNQKEITWIMKARSDMIYLNGNNYTSNEEQTLCTLCNLREKETMQHFLGGCPIMKEIRRQNFGVDLLSENEVIEILNGQRDSETWKNLISYLKAATRYREFIISEFQ